MSTPLLESKKQNWFGSAMQKHIDIPYVVFLRINQSIDPSIKHKINQSIERTINQAQECPGVSSTLHTLHAVAFIQRNFRLHGGPGEIAPINHPQIDGVAIQVRKTTHIGEGVVVKGLALEVRLFQTRHHTLPTGQRLHRPVRYSQNLTLHSLKGPISRTLDRRVQARLFIDTDHAVRLKILALIWSKVTTPGIRCNKSTRKIILIQISQKPETKHGKNKKNGKNWKKKLEFFF